jgi:hypothetical protein
LAHPRSFTLSGNVPGTIRSYGGAVGRTQLAGVPAARRFGLTSPAACAVIGVVMLVLYAAAVPLAGLAHRNLNAANGSLPVWVTAPFAVVGWVLAWRRPANPVGWIMLAAAFFFALSEDASYYTAADYGLRHGDLRLGGLALFTEVLQVHSAVAVAAATLAAAALFNPVRRRVQRRVDRLFNRARYDADQMVAGFAARLKDTVDLELVRDDLAGVVHRAMEPAHVSVWINERGLRRALAAGRDGHQQHMTPGTVTPWSSSPISDLRPANRAAPCPDPAVCQPEKRKVGSSILSLTTSFGLVPSALTSANPK